MNISDISSKFEANRIAPCCYKRDLRFRNDTKWVRNQYGASILEAFTDHYSQFSILCWWIVWNFERYTFHGDRTTFSAKVHVTFSRI